MFSRCLAVLTGRMPQHDASFARFFNISLTLLLLAPIAMVSPIWADFPTSSASRLISVPPELK